MNDYDVIVVGVGGMGSAAVHHLAQRGSRVLGIERYDIPHAMGSSHGVNRIIRMAYFEDPSYVPLLARSYELWRELEEQSGRRILQITGGIDAAPADHQVFLGSLESCRLHDLSHEVLTSAELTGRFPGYRLPPDHMAVYSPDGGYVMSEAAIVAHVTSALRDGADIRAREHVIEWTSGPNGVEVATNRGSYRANRLILTAGSWSAGLLQSLEGLAVPERQVLGWFQPIDQNLFSGDRFPIFNMEVEEGHFYGFPVESVPGFKIGLYHHLGEDVDPDDFDREPNHVDEQVLRAAVDRYFPEASGPTMALKSCLFANSPDEHFIVGAAPNHDNVLVAAGFSGHGYKFASVMGEVLADLALSGSTSHDISLLDPGRFGP